MSIRKEVREFYELGPLPDESADAPTVERFQVALERIAAPLTREEADLLVGSFGVDGCFGLAWTLLHLVETAPGPLPPLHGTNEWHRRLRERAEE